MVSYPFHPPAVTSRDGEESMETRFRRNETEVGLVKELFSEKEIATSVANISTSGLGKEEVVVSAPINFKMQVDSISQTMGLSPNTNKKAIGRGRIKRMAREKNMAQEENVMSPQSGLYNARLMQVRLHKRVHSMHAQLIMGGLPV
nr:hypothetical protein CFP56_79520 [Quercus suber]